MGNAATVLPALGLPLRDRKAYSRDPANVRNFCETMEKELGIEGAAFDMSLGCSSAAAAGFRP